MIRALRRGQAPEPAGVGAGARGSTLPPLTGRFDGLLVWGLLPRSAIEAILPAQLRLAAHPDGRAVHPVLWGVGRYRGVHFPNSRWFELDYLESFLTVLVVERRRAPTGAAAWLAALHLGALPGHAREEAPDRRAAPRPILAAIPDHRLAIAGGRLLWGLPKSAATVHLEPGAARVDHAGRRLATARWHDRPGASSPPLNTSPLVTLPFGLGRGWTYHAGFDWGLEQARRRTVSAEVALSDSFVPGLGAQRLSPRAAMEVSTCWTLDWPRWERPPTGTRSG